MPGTAQRVLLMHMLPGELKKSRFPPFFHKGSSSARKDFYPHEKVISHIRRLLAGKFARANCLHETPTQFARRMAKVEQHMNEEMGEGVSLLSLGKELHDRCEKMKKLKGERIPK